MKASAAARRKIEGEGVYPPRLCEEKVRNGMKGKEIEGVLRCKTTGLQWGLNGAMKGKEREESNAQVLGWRPSAFGGRFFRDACNLMCVGVASTTRLDGQKVWRRIRGGNWSEVEFGCRWPRIFKTDGKFKTRTLPEKTRRAGPGYVRLPAFGVHLGVREVSFD